MIFISQVMPVTGSSFDDATWSSDAMPLLVTTVMPFITGCFCVWMLLGFPKVLPHAEQKLRTSRRAVRDNSVQCEIEYEEMSHMNYQLQLERDDKQRLIDSYNREIETLESYGQVMKDTSDANKENAAKFLSELKDVKERLQEENKPCLTQ